MIQEIFVVEDNPELIKALDCKFKKNMDVHLRHVLSSELEKQLLDIPSLILINEDNLSNLDIYKVSELIRNSEDNSSTPVIALCSDNSFEHEKALLESGIHSCIFKPFDEENLHIMITNIVHLMLINRGISPLTKLPRKYSYSG